MTQATAYWTSIAITIMLLGLPIWLLVPRWIKPRLMPPALYWAILIFGGWGLAVAGVAVYNEYLDKAVSAMPTLDADDPLVHSWVADGARNVFAAMFGWAYGPMIWLFWSPAIYVHQQVRRRFGRPIHRMLRGGVG